MNIDHQSHENPQDQLVGPWIFFLVKVVGEHKGDREGNKYQAAGVEAGYKGIKGNSGQKHIEHHLVDILDRGFHGLKTINHIDAGNQYQEQLIGIEDIDAEVVGFKVALKA